MSHLSIRTLIEDTLKSIDDNVSFGYARASDFNTIQGMRDKRVHLDLLKASLDYTDNRYNLTTAWQVDIIFYKLDKLQGAEAETAKILDEMDDLATQFIQKLNVFSLDEDNDQGQTIELSTIRKEPVVKVLAEMVTGWIVTFTLTAPDDFNYCSLYDQG